MLIAVVFMHQRIKISLFNCHCDVVFLWISLEACRVSAVVALSFVSLATVVITPLLVKSWHLHYPQCNSNAMSPTVLFVLCW